MRGEPRHVHLPHRLRRVLHRPPPQAHPKCASVLICLFEGDAGDVRVFLTKRSSRLSTHSREVSLPGGKAEESYKDDADTATREAKEEISLDPSLVNVVTHLQPFLSKHLLRVTPVICILREKKFNPVLNEDGVDTIFDCPLGMFVKVLLFVCNNGFSETLIWIEECGQGRKGRKKMNPNDLGGGYHLLHLIHAGQR